MADLNAEKERIDAKHKAARAILKWLAGLPSRQDAIDVLNHVGIDLKVVVTEVKADAPK